MKIAGIGTRMRRHPWSGRLAAEWLVHRMSRAADSYELAVCQSLARRGSMAIDVGAYVGTFSLALSKAVGRSGMVLACEPQHELFEQVRNATWATRVVPFNLALSSESGLTQFRVPFTGTDGLARAQGSLEPARFSSDSAGYEVKTARLDDVVGTSHEVSLIKIDVEGHELSVLEGGQGVIAAHRPALVVEIEQRHIGTRTVAQVVDTIRNLGGYQCDFIRGQSSFPWSGFDLERDQKRWVDEAGGLIDGVDLGAYVNNFVFTRAQ